MFRVVLIDDEPWALRGLQQIVDWEQQGFVIAGAYQSAQEAWNNLAADQPDAIFSDIRMPGMTGLALMQACAALKDPPLFVMVSAYADFEYAKQALEGGAFAYILKPLEEEKIKQTVQRLYERLRRRRAQGLEALLARQVFQAMTNENGFEEVGTRFDGLEDLPQLFCVWALESENEPAGGLAAPLCLRLSDTRLVCVLPAEQEQACQTGVLCGVSAPGGNSSELPYRIKQAFVALYTLKFCRHAAAGPMRYTSHTRYLRRLSESIALDVSGRNFRRAAADLALVENAVRRGAYMLDDLTLFYNGVVTMLLHASPQADIAEEVQPFTDCFQMYGAMRNADNLFSSLRALISAVSGESARALAETQDDIERVVRYVDEHYTSDITLEQLSAQFHLSLSHLCRLFKKATGSTYTEYVTSRRMRRACELLKNTAFSVAEVGVMAGYSDYFYFNRMFKKFNGVSPARYRREETTDESGT